MSEWICSKCGETALSKCPDQRNIFPTHDIAAAICSDLGVYVLQSELCSEIVLTYTDYRKNTTVKGALERILDTLEYAKENSFLAVIGCRHNWIINSHTETVCRMGGTHENLSDYTPVKEEYDQNIEIRGAFRLAISSICGIAERTCAKEDKELLEKAKGAIYYACGKYADLIKNPEKATTWHVRWDSTKKATFDDLKSAEAFMELVPRGTMYSNAKGE